MMFRCLRSASSLAASPSSSSFARGKRIIMATSEAGSPRAPPSPAVASSLEGRTFLVTGSTDGIGKHTALKLAASGAKVLLHGRSPERCEQTLNEISKVAGPDQLDMYTYDLSELSQVRAFAEEVKSKHSSLDVLINNAGVYEPNKNMTPDGFETTFAVNVLAPFLLVHLLWDEIEAGDRPRVVNVSSISQSHKDLDFGNLQGERGYSGHGAYSTSKLCAVMFTRDLADRIAARGSAVTTNCLDPGTVNTKMLLAGWGACGIPISSADNEFDLATNPKFEGVSGKYFVDSRERTPSGSSDDRDARKQLWELCEASCGITTYAL